MFIGCSDARVVPELITQSEPGELFVVRTADNLVPAYGPDPDGVTASIEYAVSVLGVTGVVVCGRSACGLAVVAVEAKTRKDPHVREPLAGRARGSLT